jgi:hypothetical protein
VKRTPNINVRLPSGRVNIAEGGLDSVSVRINGRLADRFVVEQAGPEITVRMDQERRVTGSHDVDIVAPRGSGILIQTASADTVCEGDFGDVRIASASGNVRVDGVDDADIKTASGGIAVTRSDGRLRIRTASGHVEVESAGADVSVVTASGDVDIDDVKGDVIAKTASGGVSVDGFRGSTANVKTVSGRVRLGVVGGRTVGLDLQSLTGAITLPKEPSNRPIGGPDLRLKVKTVTGNITVEVSE